MRQRLTPSGQAVWVETRAPGSITLTEALRLVTQLRQDPSTAFCAAMESWEYPIDRTAAAVLDLFDLTAQINSKKKVKPHPARPWLVKTRRRLGNVAGRTRDQVLTLLDRARQGLAGDPDSSTERKEDIGG